MGGFAGYNALSGKASKATAFGVPSLHTEFLLKATGDRFYMSVSRPLADLRDAELRNKAFDVGLTLQSGRQKRSCLRSAVDPKETLALSQEVEY